MSRDREYIGVQLVLGQALVDPQFRSSLLSCPADVIDQFNLTAEEAEFLGSVEADSVEQFAALVEQWRKSLSAITASPSIRRAAPLKWASKPRPKLVTLRDRVRRDVTSLL